jgi:hypothetical protein
MGGLDSGGCLVGLSLVPECGFEGIASDALDISSLPSHLMGRERMFRSFRISRVKVLKTMTMNWPDRAEVKP